MVSKIDRTNRTSVQEALQAIVQEYVDFPIRKPLTDESDFSQDLGFDSLDHVDMMVSVELDFEIEIPDPDAGKIRTFGQLTNYVMQAKAAA